MEYILKIKRSGLRGGIKVSKQDFDNPTLEFKSAACCKIRCSGIVFYQVCPRDKTLLEWRLGLEDVQKENGLFDELLRRGDIYEKYPPL